MDLLQKDTLKAFILEASRATYASGDESLKKKESDGSTTIRYEKGAYSFHDNYFGGEPYGGREVVFFEGKPIWMMVYYGFVVPDVERKEVYAFLAESLREAQVHMPYRGPDFFEKAGWKYKNKFYGDVDRFLGTEKIFKDSVRVYEARYFGGLIDQ